MLFRVFALILMLPVLGHGQLKFVENKNQWVEGIDFQAGVPGGDLLISSKGFSVFLIDQERLERDHRGKHQNISEATGLPEEDPLQAHYFQINFLGGQPSRAIPVNRQDGYYNYYLGNDSCRWASGVFAYSEIFYPEIYPGVDVKISSLANNLKYDFIVKAGADANQIHLDYCGLNHIQKSGEDLVLSTALGMLTEQKPVSYQIINGHRVEVASEFQLDESVVKFNFPNGYDPCYELVVDPLLIFSTFSGSLADNWGSTATPGEHGTVYSSGVTNHHIGDPFYEGGPFPATPGAFQTAYGGNYDIAIIKYDSVGSKFLYASYLGGSNNETPHSLVMDANTKDLLVLGTTSSTNYPTTTGAFDRSFGFGQPIATNVIPYLLGSDIIITRINQQGTQVVASTYLGGNLNDGINIHPTQGGTLVKNYGDEMRGDIITDDLGNVYIASVTTSTNYPVTAGFGQFYEGGATDAVVTKLSSGLSSIIWSGFLGGFGFDAAYSIKFDNNKNIIVAGGTTSGDFPITSGTYQPVLGGVADGWIARIAADGSQILQSTFTGTTSFDQVYFIDLNDAGEIYCFGQSAGAMPTTPGVYQNPNSGQFLQKFSSDLTTLVFSTVFGSGTVFPNISPTAFLVNECNNIYMSGWGGLVNDGYWSTNTFGMPVTADALQPTTHGSDFYFMVLNSDATDLVYATYLGGSQTATHVDGGTSRFDKFGIVYHAVCAGCDLTGTGSTSDFPTTPGAKSRVNKSKNCNNAAFKFDLSSLRARFRTNNVTFTMPDFNNVCYPDTVRFQNLSTGGELFKWDLGDGTTINKTKTDTASILHQYQQEGQYNVRLIAIDDNTCSNADTTYRLVNYFIPEIEIGDGTALCEGTSFQLQASGGSIYSWTSDNQTFTSNAAAPIVQPASTTTYYVAVTDAHGCVRKDTLLVNVTPKIDFDWSWDFISDCLSRPQVSLRNDTKLEPDDMSYFDFGDGEKSDHPHVIHTYAADNDYTIRILGVREACVFEESVQLPIYTLLVPNVFTPGGSPGFNDTFKVVLGENAPSDAGILVSLLVVDRWGKPVYESHDYQNNWNASEVESGVYFLTLELDNVASCKTWLQVVK